VSKRSHSQIDKRAVTLFYFMCDFFSTVLGNENINIIGLSKRLAHDFSLWVELTMPIFASIRERHDDKWPYFPLLNQRACDFIHPLLLFVPSRGRIKQHPAIMHVHTS